MFMIKKSGRFFQDGPALGLHGYTTLHSIEWISINYWQNQTGRNLYIYLAGGLHRGILLYQHHGEFKIFRTQTVASREFKIYRTQTVARREFKIFRTQTEASSEYEIFRAQTVTSSEFKIFRTQTVASREFKIYRTQDCS